MTEDGVAFLQKELPDAKTIFNFWVQGNPNPITQIFLLLKIPNCMISSMHTGTICNP